MAKQRRDFWLYGPNWFQSFGRWVEERTMRHRPRGGIGPTLEEFYAEDERRRTSADVRVPGDWRDARGRPHEVYWLESTHEVYAMLIAKSGLWAGAYGGQAVPTGAGPNPTVRVLGTVASFRDLTDHLGLAHPVGEAGAIEQLEHWLRDNGGDSELRSD